MCIKATKRSVKHVEQAFVQIMHNHFVINDANTIKKNSESQF